DGGVPKHVHEPHDFLAFERPGYARAAMNFYLASWDGEVSCLTTETRVAVADKSSHRKFARYWHIISLGSALIRLEWLRAIKCRAESDSSAIGVKQGKRKGA